MNILNKIKILLKRKNKKPEYKPKEYFDYLKNKIETIDDKTISNMYKSAMELTKEYEKLGQTEGIKSLKFQLFLQKK